jgi:hypothetical protein
MQWNRTCFSLVKVEQKFSPVANNQLRFLVGEFSAERCSISRRGTPMSVSAILRSAFDQPQIGSSNNPCQQSISQLAKDLQSGNLSAGLSDFSSQQAAFSQPSTTTGASTTPATQSTASRVARRPLASSAATCSRATCQRRKRFLHRPAGSSESWKSATVQLPRPWRRQ